MQIGMQSQSSHGDAAASLQAVFLMACFICVRRARRPLSLHACATDSNNNYCASLQVTRNKSRPTAS
jgi:hypothetical protein